MIPRYLSELLYWQSQKFRGRTPVRARLQQLHDTQHFSPSEMQEYQFQKLRTVLEHAWRTIPYYRRLMKERGITSSNFDSPAVLQKLPLLTRPRLIENQEILISSEADTATLQTNFSSGSTGNRAKFVQDANFRMWMRAHQLRTYEWCAKWRLGERFVLLWGSEIYWSLKSRVDTIDNILSNRREINTFCLSPELIRQFVNQLVAFDPVLISSYTNAMHLIAKEVERRKLSFKSLRAIQLTSEPVPPAFKSRLQSIFNCEVYDKYGSRETNIVSHESPAHDGMLIQQENVFVEILDENDQLCPAGKDGRVVLTTLNNFAMPLIRYETSDISSFIAAGSAVLPGFARMSSVAGRLQDLIVTPNGAHVDAYFFSYLLMRFDEVDWFQIVQSDLNTLHIRLYCPRGIGVESLDAIRERIFHHCNCEFVLTFEQLNSMPVSPTGKFRLCISELGQQATTLAGSRLTINE